MYGRESKTERFAVAASQHGDYTSGIVLCVDGPIVTNELDNSHDTDDWLTGNPPGPGLWIWEGSGLHPYQGYEGDWSDPSLDGKWRRPTAIEAWHLLHGRNPWVPQVAAA